MIFLSVAVAMFCQSCNTIPGNDRYIELPPITVERAVLLEDFTGQNCVNCPEAHKVIEELEAQYGSDKLIAVSIHCGDFGISVNRTNFGTGYIGLMTEEGNAINSAYGINQWPMGVVDMGSPLNLDQWAAAVRNALMKTSDIELSLDAGLTTDGVISIKSEVKSSRKDDVAIQFWIIEDNIIARQRYPDRIVNDYRHNNVFRAMLYPPEGKKLSLNREGVMVNTEIELRDNSSEKWVVENLSVVAFVFDDSGVLQVTKSRIN